MSTISNRHTVVPFVAGKTAPLTGQRLAKVGYKTTKKQKAKFANVAVSVPMIDKDAKEFNDAIGTGKFDNIIIAALQDAQDGIIRSLYESADGSLQSVSDDEIGIDACLAFIEAEQTGGRLTKEMIAEWFDETLADNLTVTVADKLKFMGDDLTEEQQKTVAKHVQIYKDVLASLAGGKTLLQPTQIKGCKTALSLDLGESEIGKKLMARLIAMETPKMTAEMLEL